MFLSFVKKEERMVENEVLFILRDIIPHLKERKRETSRAYKRDGLPSLKRRKKDP